MSWGDRSEVNLLAVFIASQQEHPRPPVRCLALALPVYAHTPTHTHTNSYLGQLPSICFFSFSADALNSSEDEDDDESSSEENKLSNELSTSNEKLQRKPQINP